VRDFLYLKPDLIAFHDRVSYASATYSPTQWNAIFPGEPSITGQRITMTYAGQKLVQDVVLPAGAQFRTIDLARSEDASLQGFRLETISGASNGPNSPEYSLQVLQGMDAGTAPAPVTILTTTNADVVQVGSSYVIGFVKGEALAAAITYHYTGAPTHYVIGLAPSTAYHVINTAGTITISAATGFADLTTTAAGLLVLSSQ
jgi:hypothetical protein